MIADDVFTKEHKERAMDLEIMVASELARYYKTKLPDAKTPTPEEMGKMPMVEQLKLIRDTACELAQINKNVELLNAIKEGKYRILFLALARALERQAETVMETFNSDPKMQELFDILGINFTEEETEDE